MSTDDYPLSAEQVPAYQRDGYLTLPDVVNEAELAELEATFERFIRGQVPGMGRDFCDMSGPYGRAFDDFNLVNAVLPRVYEPALVGNVFERRATPIARQLIGDDAVIDYDQLLAKRPQRPAAMFAWHQDLGYWPSGTPDTRTVTCSLALDDATPENGCLRVVPGSHLEPQLRPIAPRPGRPHPSCATKRTRSASPSTTRNGIVSLPVRRGSITVHNERIVHGSGGNHTDGWRRTYVIAHRSAATVAHERRIGFTHSHNDRINWQTNLEALAVS